jgi:hypothetical protein
MSENKEVEKVNPFDRTIFQEQFFNIDDYNIDDTDLIVDTNIAENMFK